MTPAHARCRPSRRLKTSQPSLPLCICLSTISSSKKLLADKLAPSWRRFFQRGSSIGLGHARHNRISLLKYLFPNSPVDAASRYTKARLFNLRYWFLPSLKLRVQSKIYRLLVNRNAPRPKLVSNLQGRNPTFWRRRYVKDGPELQKAKMAYNGSWPTGPSNYADYSGYRSEGREPGARRKKLAGYLKAANEIRQTYFSQDGMGTRDGSENEGVEGPGSFPDAAVVRSGNEEMMLFPSYARKHIKVQMKPQPPPDVEISEQDYWHRQWEQHQDDKAVVDVDVRGWIYTPQRGNANRKQRLMIGLARQLSGVPAPPLNAPGETTYDSDRSSRAPSPTRQDEEFIAREAENIVRKGEQEQRYARRGAFSEQPERNADTDSVYDFQPAGTQPNDTRTQTTEGTALHRLSQISLASSTDGESITPPKTQKSWPLQTKMSSADLHVANRHLISRLKPFMAIPLANSPITAFFYNATASRQHTVYTNPAGHFSCRASLDFVPTHVRVLAGQDLSATEEVFVTEPHGVSLISDIDDTVKHSAVTAGAREIFRTAFIRELGDLTIDGVREWYSTLSDMGVKLHYVSNSPWQMYPILTTYFKLANLPKGSFHLKQYTGMLQGIFEPVAERKRANLDKIFRDFPDRKFILVGDSGEADLEVYTEVALENPSRVLGIFIRDVTTIAKTGYFDSSDGGTTGGRDARGQAKHRNGDNGLSASKRLSRPDDTRSDDADLQAAIAASLAEVEKETRQARRNINPDVPSSEGREKLGRPALPQRRTSTQTLTNTPVFAPPEEDLIDFSEETAPNNSVSALTGQTSPPTQHHPDLAFLAQKPTPSPPLKPKALRSPPPNTQQQKSNPENTMSPSKTPPPRPRKPSTAVWPSPQEVQSWTSPAQLNPNSRPPEHQPSPLRQVTAQSPTEAKKERPPLPSRLKSRGLFASRDKSLFPPTGSGASTCLPRQPGTQPNQLPPPSSGMSADSPRMMSVLSTQPSESLRPLTAIKGAAPAPPLRRRNTPVLPPGTLANRKASNRLSGGWDDGSGGSLPGSPSEAGVSRKEFLWLQRWARSKRILESQGVTLRTWRIGSDVADVCVKLAEMEFREIDKQRRTGGIAYQAK